MKTLTQFKEHLATTQPSKSWTEAHIEKAFALAMKDAAPPGTDISNLDSVHKAILGIPDTLKALQEAQEKFHKAFEEHRSFHCDIQTKMHSCLMKMVGDMEPGDPNSHDPNAGQDPSSKAPPLVSSQEMDQLIKVVNSLVDSVKAQKEALFALTGQP